MNKLKDILTILYIKYFGKNSDDSNLSRTDLSDYDYESLVELYYKIEWLKSETNHPGFERLWKDCTTKAHKIVLKRLLLNFTNISQDAARVKAKTNIINCIANWKIEPNNTLFIGFKFEQYSDGSELALNFIRPIFNEINEEWKKEHFIGDIVRGKRRIEDKSLKNIVLVDDFIGSGKTAKNRIKEIAKDIKEKGKSINVFVFSIGCLKAGKLSVESNGVPVECVYETDKGTVQAFPLFMRDIARKLIIEMEGKLHPGSQKLMLEDHSLGYERSEALFVWNVFNIPNNNYPVFWWKKYSNGGKRIPMFTRMN